MKLRRSKKSQNAVKDVKGKKLFQRRLRVRKKKDLLFKIISIKKQQRVSSSLPLIPESMKN